MVRRRSIVEVVKAQPAVGPGAPAAYALADLDGRTGRRYHRPAALRRCSLEPPLGLVERTRSFDAPILLHSSIDLLPLADTLGRMENDRCSLEADGAVSSASRRRPAATIGLLATSHRGSAPSLFRLSLCPRLRAHFI
jgi:hypothetical protein